MSKIAKVFKDLPKRFNKAGVKKARTYYFSLDTYVDGQGVEQSGEYTFVVLACEAGDTDCLL